MMLEGRRYGFGAHRFSFLSCLVDILCGESVHPILAKNQIFNIFTCTSIILSLYCITMMIIMLFPNFHDQKWCVSGSGCNNWVGNGGIYPMIYLGRRWAFLLLQCWCKALLTFLYTLTKMSVGYYAHVPWFRHILANFNFALALVYLTQYCMSNICITAFPGANFSNRYAYYMYER